MPAYFRSVTACRSRHTCLAKLALRRRRYYNARGVSANNNRFRLFLLLFLNFASACVLVSHAKYSATSPRETVAPAVVLSFRGAAEESLFVCGHRRNLARLATL